LIRKTLEVLYDGRREAEEDVAMGIKQLKSELAAERSRLTIPTQRSSRGSRSTTGTPRWATSS
jgi:hypothetical protein